ncbi:hypothetical protein Tco_1070504 [Tanacetum coccineum]|uniref:Uncharacterized protein n=1 Tax=Tanacetum coccineum TaxID=301880 RepID=A0ABQ5HLL5_9ASTR
MEVMELRMLRWTCGKTMLDMIPNGVYKAELEVETIINKIREGRLRWFGHVRRRPQSTPVRRVEALVVDDLSRRGRPKLRWEDRVKHDMKELLLFEDMTSNRNEWRARISFRGLGGRHRDVFASHVLVRHLIDPRIVVFIVVSFASCASLLVGFVILVFSFRCFACCVLLLLSHVLVLLPF